MSWITKDYYKTDICGRCGKEIAEDDFCIKMEESDPFRGRKVSYWCEECYNEFKKIMDEE